MNPITDDPLDVLLPGGDPWPARHRVMRVDTLRSAMPGVKRWLTFGQSSGGYAALYASQRLESSLAIAFSPQTHNDSALSSKMYFSKNMNKACVVFDIADLRDVFSNSTRESAAMIISSINERDNPVSSFVWLDHMHWARISDFENVRIFILDSENHAILWKRGTAFAGILAGVAGLKEFGADTVGAFLTEQLRELEERKD